MEVKIVNFPETNVAVLEHHGPPQQEHDTVRKLIEWRRQNCLSLDRHQSYGIHYTDPRKASQANHHVDFCLSVDQIVPPNPQGVVNKVIPNGRCAVVQHFGSRTYIAAAVYLYEIWFPTSGEALRDFPIFFHYVNVGPHVQEHEMITDVYLPLK